MDIIECFAIEMSSAMQNWLKISYVTCCQLYVWLCLEYLIEQTRNAVGALGCIKDTCEEYGKDKKGWWLTMMDICDEPKNYQ